MSDEIKKAQEEAQRMAKELGIYEIVRNVASNGENTDEPCNTTWEKCIVVFESPNGEPLPKIEKSTSISSLIAMTMRQGIKLPDCETKITMPNGTILYRALEEGEEVTDFRYGAWVERLKAYSEQITATKQQEADAKQKQDRDVQLKPFSQIDF